MSPAHLTTGFFGKIPATGDFVSRGLPGEFVRQWDRWAARHLAPLITDGTWPDPIGLRFLLGPGALSPSVPVPMAGITLPSADRIGRRFPLTVAASLMTATTNLAVSASRWFDQIEDAATAAQAGSTSADEFAAELAALPFPTVEAGSETVRGIVFWIDTSQIVDLDQDAPRAVLEHLLTIAVETG